MNEVETIILSAYCSWAAVEAEQHQPGALPSGAAPPEC